MRKDLYREMYELEDKYWWHIAKRDLVRMLIQNSGIDMAKSIYMDIGCGTGRLMEEMQKGFGWKKVTGVDGSGEALRFCKKRGLVNVSKGDFEEKLPAKSASVDVATCLDVIEHIENEKVIMSEIFRVLKPGGILVVTVPAYQFMWTYWDDMLFHKRRYTKNDMAGKLAKVGFKIEKSTYAFSFLFPPAVLVRIAKSLIVSLRSRSDFAPLPSFVEATFKTLSKWERGLIGKMNIPFGLSVVCVARKK